ncbi:MAG: B-box zinc finger protein [Deltaproteobacteria bacterium]|nr:B-box zinc finger protein [Deltaproteobacteria bacterium]
MTSPELSPHPPLAVEGEVGPACAKHPDAPAAAICERCGAFACAGCLAFVAGKPFCDTCRRREDVDYTRAIEAKFRGRRDAFVWFFGLTGTLGNLVVLGTLIFALAIPEELELGVPGGVLSALPQIVFAAIAIVVYGAYFLLKPWARLGLFGLILLGAVSNALTFAGTEEGMGFGFGASLGRQVLPFIFFLSAYKSTRNQLAFDLEVPREALEKMYRAYYDNQLARAGFVLSLFSLLVPGLALLSGILSFIGLRRVNAESVPPVGRKKTAIAGVVLSVIGLFTGGLLVFGALAG